MKGLTIDDLQLRIGSALSRFTPRASRSSLLTFHLPLAGLILLFFHKMAFSNLILARGDTFLYFYPYWNAAAEALKNGRIPLWNPHLFMGVPFLANSQVGVFYPPNWLVWWLWPTPYAVSASILLHLFIAGWGTWLAGRHALNLGKTAALFSALLFALGGYLTAQVEHINQLQGLAWLPWFFVVMAYCANEKEQSRGVVIGRSACAITLLFALQLLAGHTQTAFITGVALSIWSITFYLSQYTVHHTPYALRFTFHISHFTATFPLTLLMGLLLAGGVTAVQLLPTLELAGLSSRQGGLTPNEVLSFSLHPLLLTRALLPGYGQVLFSEYVTFVPITAVFLAFIAAWQWRKWPGVLPAIALVLISLLLAFGVFNPLNWVLARLPGFNLFRVPARWLVLLAFGVSLLAGLGWQIVLDRWLLSVRPWADVPARAQAYLWQVERPLRAALFTVLGLWLWSGLATILAIFIPTGAEAPYEAANTWTTLAWAVELLLVYWLLSGQRLGVARWRLQMKQTAVSHPTPLVLITLFSLFLASRSHPYNHLTTPEAWFDLRPPVTRLWAEGEQYSVGSFSPFTIFPPALLAPRSSLSPRFLSLSNIFFDPGDQAEIDTIYTDKLSETARYDYTVAIKQKEIIAPNLPMAYGLSAVDGFDGGILPLRAYTELVSLILPPGVSSTDGRLREYLDAVPPAKWLDLFNTRYLITDKTGDEWREGVFFDKQHPVTANEPISVEYIPPFAANEVWLIAANIPGMVTVETADSRTWQLTPQHLQNDLYHVVLPETAVLQHLTLSPGSVLAISLVNTADDTFQTLVPGQYRLIHSGDVKIYENLDVLPRAFLLNDWQIVGNVSDGLAMMAADNFQPEKTAVLQTTSPAPAPQPTTAPPGTAHLLTYQPEQVVIQTESETAVLLVLTDTYYPGWAATVDGAPSEIYQVNVLFRGVIVPAGTHQVIFEFHPRSFENGRIISLVSLVIMSLVGINVVKRNIPLVQP